MRSTRRLIVVVACLGWVPLACGSQDPSTDGTGTGTGTGGGGSASSDGADGTGMIPTGPGPYRDQWRVEADLEFFHTDPGGAPLIFDVDIGGRLTDDNFANRGDVIVGFDGPADRILIELRRFTFAQNAEQAQEHFDLLSLWAYDAPLGPPQTQDPIDDCTAGPWRTGCPIRVYFDDLAQLEQSGADIRVTLPPDYRQRVSIVTEDNEANPDYLNRGEVCVQNLHASASIEVGSGNVRVSLAPDATEAPGCTAQEIEDCEATAWAPECECVANVGQFGNVAVDNRDSSASNVVVDVPAGLWTTMSARNEAEGQQARGEHCEAMLTVPGVELEPVGNDFPWQARGSANFPGLPALAGAGFNVQLSSSDCRSIAFTLDPAGYVGEGNGPSQMAEERGNLEVCSGCITQSCNELLP